MAGDQPAEEEPTGRAPAEGVDEAQGPDVQEPSEAPEPQEAASRAGGGSTSAPRSGRLTLAVVAVVALIVGVAVGWAVGASGDDDGDSAATADDHDADHDGHDGMDDHGDDAADTADADAADDDGLAALLADHHYDAPVDEPIDGESRRLLAHQLAAVNDLVEQFPTVADAQAADYRRAGPFIPGLGTHYIHRDTDRTFTIPNAVDTGAGGEEVRTLLIYDGLGDDARLVGAMFMALGDEAPEGFAGPYDTWHQHTNICVVVDREGDIELPFVGDQDNVTDEMCTDRGGRMTDLSAHMVHVWSVPGYASELGMFSEVNPLITCPDGTYDRVPYDRLEEPYDTTCVA